MKDIAIESIDTLSVEVDSGKIVRIGMELTLYPPMPRNSSLQSKLARVLSFYLNSIGHNIRYFNCDDSDQWLNFDANPLLPADVASADVIVASSLAMHGGSQAHEACPLHFSYFLPASWDPEPDGYVSLGIPISDISSADTMNFLDIARKACVELNPVWGVAGLSVLTNPSWRNDRDVQTAILYLLERFPGLQYNAGVLSSKTAQKGIISANWLTILGPEFTKRFGGPDALSNTFANTSAKVEPFNEGAFVLSDKVPELGDRDVGVFPESYRIVGNALKPLRTEPENSFFFGPLDFDVMQYTKNWCARFD